MGIEDSRKSQEGLRMKFKICNEMLTFTVPRFTDYRKFLVWKKTGENTATWAGFKVGYQDEGISSRSLMQHQGQTIEIDPEEEVEIA